MDADIKKCKVYKKVVENDLKKRREFLDRKAEEKEKIYLLKRNLKVGIELYYSNINNGPDKNFIIKNYNKIIYVKNLNFYFNIFDFKKL